MQYHTLRGEKEWVGKPVVLFRQKQLCPLCFIMQSLILSILSANCFLQGVCLPAEQNSPWEKLCAVNEIASNSTKPCQFPFIYENKTFYGCTRLYGGENGNPWCSTKINPLTYDHIVGQDLYGDCTDNSCPTEEQGVKSYEKFLNISTSTYAIQICKALKVIMRFQVNERSPKKDHTTRK